MKITSTKGVRLLLALAVFSAGALKAQTTFVRTYNKGNMGYTVREVNGNSYVVAGGTDFYYNFHWFMQSSLATTNIHLFKTDVSGVLQWERVISKLNTRMIARWMEPTLDGGFILTGATNTDQVWPPDSNDVVLVKTDGTGMVSWSKIFDSGKDEVGFCVQQTADSGYIISGFHDAVPMSLVGNTYILLIKTNALGVVQWEKKYQFAIRDLDTFEPFTYVVKQTSDGAYVVTGGLPSSHPSDVNVLRTDAMGNILWAKTYEQDNTIFRISLGLDIIETSSGDFVIAGSMDKDQPLHLNYPYYLKISSTGLVLKSRLFETVPNLSFQSGFSSVEQTPDGGFFFTGMGGYSNFGTQAQLLKTDANLDVQWTRVYTADGLSTVGSMSGRHTSDGGYVFTGKRNMAGSMLMKTNSLGLVDCKIPNTLVEYTPSLIVNNWTPSIISGIISSSPLLSVTTPLVDTTIACPVFIPLLPVELNYFAAKAIPDRMVSVEWTTESETNNAYFIIEKSHDNKYFSDAGKVTGAGNSTTSQTYSFKDENPYSTPVSYYRLRQVDYDGSEHFSKSVPVSFGSRYFELMSARADYENNSLIILLGALENENVFYTLTDALGKVVVSESAHVSKGISHMTLDMRNFSKGIYFLSATNGEKMSKLKVAY